MVTVSIVIPVYNTGNYLYKCVESLLLQTLRDIEIVIVDDGSHEDTAAICEELAARDSRIRVYHKPNEGVSKARNYALDRVTGKYIGFVDSDDWVDTTMYQTLVDTIEQQNADLVYCDATTTWDDGRSASDTFSTLSNSTILETKNLSPRTTCEIAGSAWRGLFKSSTLKKYNIRFPEDLKFSEDRIFNLLVLTHVSRIYYLKQSFYFRFMRKGSCVNSNHPDAASILLRSSFIMQQLAGAHWGEEHRKIYQRQLVTGFIGSLYRIIEHQKTSIARYQEFHKMASTHELHVTISILHLSDIRSRLIAHSHYRILYLLMKMHTFYKKLRS